MNNKNNTRAIVRTQSETLVRRLVSEGLQMIEPKISRGQFPNGMACFPNGTFCVVSLDNTIGEWNRFVDCGTNEEKFFSLAVSGC